MHDLTNCPASNAHSAARHLIPRACHVDPLGCPACQNPMRVIAAIDDPQVMEKTYATWLSGTIPPPPRLPRAWRGSRPSAGKGSSGAVPTIGNEPDRPVPHAHPAGRSIERLGSGKDCWLTPSATCGRLGP
jgi:hypothetical protein